MRVGRAQFLEQGGTIRYAIEGDYVRLFTRGKREDCPSRTLVPAWWWKACEKRLGQFWKMPGQNFQCWGHRTLHLRVVRGMATRQSARPCRDPILCRY